MTIFRNSQVLKDVGMCVRGELFTDACGEVSIGFTNITGETNIIIIIVIIIIIIIVVVVVVIKIKFYLFHIIIKNTHNEK